MTPSSEHSKPVSGEQKAGLRLAKQTGRCQPRRSKTSAFEKATLTIDLEPEFQRSIQGQRPHPATPHRRGPSIACGQRWCLRLRDAPHEGVPGRVNLRPCFRVRRDFQLNALRAVEHEHVGDFGLGDHQLVLHLPRVVNGKAAFRDRLPQGRVAAVQRALTSRIRFPANVKPSGLANREPRLSGRK